MDFILSLARNIGHRRTVCNLSLEILECLALTVYYQILIHLIGFVSFDEVRNKALGVVNTL